MKQYALVHGVCGIWEGYSETSCDFYDDLDVARKHAGQLVKTFEEDDYVIQIDHPEDDLWYYHMDDGSGDMEYALRSASSLSSPSTTHTARTQPNRVG